MKHVHDCIDYLTQKEALMKTELEDMQRKMKSLAVQYEALKQDYSDLQNQKTVLIKMIQGVCPHE